MITMGTKHIFIDASAFLGLHSSDDIVRNQSATFFIRELKAQVFMSLEQVGLCDDVIWGFSREQQDDYFPFMDLLHSSMDIRRVPYAREDLYLAMNDTVLTELPIYKALAVAQVINHSGLLFTHDKSILGIEGLSCMLVEKDEGDFLCFPEPLNSLYKRSEALKVSAGNCHVDFNSPENSALLHTH